MVLLLFNATIKDSARRLKVILRTTCDSVCGENYCRVNKNSRTRCTSETCVSDLPDNYITDVPCAYVCFRRVFRIPMEGLAFWIASETITNCEECNGVSYGLISRQAYPSGESVLLHSIEDKLAAIAGNDAIWIAASWGNDEPQSATITLMGSEAGALAPHVAERLVELTGQSRLQGSLSTGRSLVLEYWNRETDEDMLRSVLRQALEARSAREQPPAPRPIPPPGSSSVDQLLARARSSFRRLTPSEAHQALATTATRYPVTDVRSPNLPPSPQTILIDIRPEAQRRTEGHIPGALIVERNVLEWRFDPQCDARLAEPTGITDRYDNQLIVFCSDGYTSSLAAASLLDLGLENATDIEGGFHAWKAAGLPVGAADSHM